MARRKSQLVGGSKPPKSLRRYEIDTLTQGVSQQPSHLRQVGQGTHQVNGWSSPVNGLTKRRPTKLVGKVRTTAIEDFYLETMPVDADERYSVWVYKDPAKADKIYIQFLLDGQTCSLKAHGTGMKVVTNADNGAQEIECDKTSYIYNASELRKKYVLINNGAIGLLTNREKKTELDPDLTPKQPYEALLFFQGINYQVKYELKIDDQVIGAVTTPRASDSTNALSTDATAAQFANLINNYVAEEDKCDPEDEDCEEPKNYEAIANGSVVWLRKKDKTDFSIQLDDSRSNTLARAIKGSVTRIDELPLIATDDFLIKVEQDASSTEDDQWLKFITRDQDVSFGDGSWQETAAPEIQFRLNKDTMPLVIRREADRLLFVGPADGAEEEITIGDDTFTYQFPEWGERTAGDETTAPTPTFVGYPLRDHVLFRSRYVVVGGEAIVASRVDDIFDFFSKTALQVLETDPIDIKAASETSIPLNWILPVDESLLVFSAKSQFRLQAADADVLTPRTAIVLRLSNIDMNPDLRPKIAGPNAVFATEEYGFTGFREYQFIDTQSRRIGLNLGGSQNITLNVPKYLDGNAPMWDVGESLDYFVARSGGDEKKLFVYKYLWQVTTGSVIKQQASWSEWIFDGDIQWCRFFDNKLWMVMTYPDGTFISTIDAEELTETTAPEVYLDRQLMFPECNEDFQASNNITASYSELTKRTTFKLPFINRGTLDAVVRLDSPNTPGLILGTIDTETDTLVTTVQGDFTEYKIMFGCRYEFSYEFTNAYVPVRDQSKQRIIGELDGRLQVSTWTINHFNTGRYEVTVKRKSRKRDTQYTFVARALNTFNNKLDTETSILETGTFRVPIYSRNTECNITVKSDSWLPVTLLSACWEGNYTNRARSLG